MSETQLLETYNRRENVRIIRMIPSDLRETYDQVSELAQAARVEVEE